MNLRYIRVQYNTGSKHGRVIVQLVDELRRQRRKNAMQHLVLTQVIQLYRKTFKRHKEAA